MNPNDLHQLLRAISFAARVHEGQQRKDKQTPYVAHPLRVLAVLVSFGVEDPETLMAAALHDTLEDTTADRDDLIEQFGPRVAEWVAALSKDKRLPEEERERQYLETLSGAALEVKLCKLADLYDNLLDSLKLTSALRRKRIVQTRELLEHFSPRIPSNWQHALHRVREQLDVIEKTEQNEGAGR